MSNKDIWTDREKAESPMADWRFPKDPYKRYEISPFQRFLIFLHKLLGTGGFKN